MHFTKDASDRLWNAADLSGDSQPSFRNLLNRYSEPHRQHHNIHPFSSRRRKIPIRVFRKIRG